MKDNILKPVEALGAFLKVKPVREEIESFKKNLNKLLNRINEQETEDFHRNLIIEFLKDTYYKDNYFINTKGRNDLVIHNGKKAESKVAVLIETKKPKSNERLRKDNINKKALHELILYYLRERITNGNLEIKYLIGTDIFEWYIFNSNIFEKYFAQNKSFVRQFNDFEANRLSGTDTKFFYDKIAEPFVEKIKNELTFTWFDIRNYEEPLRKENKIDDKKLIALFKLLSPQHLLKLELPNDSNSLNKKFYSELLHIIGLGEIKKGSKKLIERKKPSDRNSGSLIENTIKQLDKRDIISRIEKSFKYGNTPEERLYNIALSLTITWVNRILFLKLLESQLISYHRGDKEFSFLNLKTVKNFDDLDDLFFSVLARKTEERSQEVINRYGNIPFLNSSLFEPSELERQTIYISNLEDERSLTILSNTVLKSKYGKKFTGKKNTLEYLFEFLNAYDFSSEGKEDIQEKKRTLINASVLGLIFEKINGYKDGSFFTPGFITMYMSKETIRKAVVQKFSAFDKYKNIKNFDDLKDVIDTTKNGRKEANEIINSLRICDPAVGSGHFLVSALNEVITIKSELEILNYRDGSRIKNYIVRIDNDELIVFDEEEDEIFNYTVSYKDGKRYVPQEKQSLQEALFQEKQNIIENCLFGVDINLNSVKICRLRLWIELLKNAYYKPENNYKELETLPNIDINIKNGNSLVSRFPLDSDLKQALRKSKWNIDSYRLAVNSYRNAKSKEHKKQMEKLISNIKSDFRSEISKNSKEYRKLDKLRGDLFNLTNQTYIFELTEKEKKIFNEKVEKFTDEIKKQERIIEDIKNNKIYENAFEWRFEFPEVLDDAGNYTGFDVIIGNPPYIGEKENSRLFEEINQLDYWKDFYRRRTNTYYFFIREGNELLREGGYLSLIVPREFTTADWANKLRKYMLNNLSIQKIIDFNALQVFEEARTSSMIILTQKVTKALYNFRVFNVTKDKIKTKDIVFDESHFKISHFNNDILDYAGTKLWTFGQDKLLKDELLTIQDLFDVSQGIVTGADKVTSKHFESGYVSKGLIGRGIFILNKEIDIEFEKSNIFLKINDKWLQLNNKEKGFLKPYISGVNLSEWYISESSYYILYVGNKEISNNLIFQYLRQFETVLLNRSKIVKNHTISISEFKTFTKEDVKKNYSSAGAVQKIMRKGTWYLPLYERTEFNFNGPKIIVNSKNMFTFAYSESPHYSSGGGLGGQNIIFPNRKRDPFYYNQIQKNSSINDFMKYVNSILNSKIIRDNIRKGKYNQLSTNKIKELLIYKIDFSNKDDKILYNKIVELANQAIKEKANRPLKDITNIEQQIDKKVYQLYGFTSE